MNLAYIVIAFSFLVANQPISINIDLVKDFQLISSTSEISTRDCDECENDYTHLGSECCDTAWIEYGVNCDELESAYSWDCSGCSCPGDEPVIDEESCEGEWIENIEWGSCNQLNPSMSNGVSYCNDSSTNTDQCYTYTCYGGSYGSWGTCCGGEDYIIDNSYCEEVEVLDCSELNHGPCMSNSECEWVENIESVTCGGFGDAGSCNSVSGCNWECDSWYTWLCGCEGQYEVDYSYCTDIESSECFGINQQECSSDSNCNWVSDIEYGSCSEFNQNTSACEATVGCYGAYQYPGWYSGWYCAGGNYQIDISYCEELEYQLGDINGDSSINILDVIEMINLILENEYNQVVDMNSDNSINVLDIVIIVEIILGN